jgi:polysaccharide deacetylase 2 family uncharacterized protein YibQ
VPLDPDVAALPDGKGAKLAVVVDDVGGVDTYLGDYLKLPIPLTLSVIPAFANASADDAKIVAAGKEVLLHIPLANRAGAGGVPDGGLGVDATPEAVDQWVATAVAKVPHADGANNHEGPFGSASPPLMQRLIATLNARHLFFIDSVTSQRTVGYAMALAAGMPGRINNVFMDHLESDPDSRAALLRLATVAAGKGGAIGICHVFHQYEQHALAALADQLRSKGYVFVTASQVTNEPTSDGLDAGVRTRL